MDLPEIDRAEFYDVAVASREEVKAAQAALIGVRRKVSWAKTSFGNCDAGSFEFGRFTNLTSWIGPGRSLPYAAIPPCGRCALRVPAAGKRTSSTRSPGIGLLTRRLRFFRLQVLASRIRSAGRSTPPRIPACGRLEPPSR